MEVKTSKNPQRNTHLSSYLPIFKQRPHILPKEVCNFSIWFIINLATLLLENEILVPGKFMSWKTYLHITHTSKMQKYLHQFLYNFRKLNYYFFYSLLNRNIPSTENSLINDLGNIEWIVYRDFWVIVGTDLKHVVSRKTHLKFQGGLNLKFISVILFYKMIKCDNSNFFICFY